MFFAHPRKNRDRRAGVADDVEALAVRYARHIEYGEKELLPMAARLVSDEDLARVGRAMRERRGIDEV